MTFREIELRIIKGYFNYNLKIQLGIVSIEWKLFTLDVVVADSINYFHSTHSF